jgi:signal transduction histidine kinase
LIYLALSVDWEASLIGETALLTLLILLAGSFPLPVAPKIKADVTTAVMLGAVIILDAGAAALAATVGVTCYTFLLRFWGERIRLPWSRYPFNTGVTALYVGLASLVFHELTAGNEIASPALVSAAAVMYFTNTILVTGAASLQMGLNPLEFWWAGTRQNGLAEVSLMGVGILGAIAYRENPGMIATLVVPTAIVYIAFSRLAQSNTRLEEAAERLTYLQGEIAKQAKLASVGAISLDIAHQIKNPLAILMGRLEIAQECLSIDNPCQRHVQIAASAGERIKNLTESFTSVGHQELVKLDPRELLEEAFGMARLLHTGAIETRWEFEAGLPHIYGNPMLLREALSNVFSNAIEAVDGSGTIKTSTSRENGYVVTRITDDGCGVPKEIMENLFEPFRSTKPDGSGLGLFATKHIVEMHRGRIKVESREGHGTSVTIALPIHQPQTESELVSSLDGNGTPLEGPLVSTED